MCDRPMTWDELCAEMVKQRKRAEKAEARVKELEEGMRQKSESVDEMDYPPTLRR